MSFSLLALIVDVGKPKGWLFKWFMRPLYPTSALYHQSQFLERNPMILAIAYVIAVHYLLIRASAFWYAEAVRRAE
jgi:hypothetical protein